MSDNFLHIYAQTDWHSESFIVGTTPALKALRDAIDQALEKNSAVTESMVNDGEGFDIVVACVDNLEEFDKLSVPYTSDIAKEHNSAAKDPWEIFNAVKAMREAQDARRKRQQKKNKNKFHDLGGEG